MVKGVAAVFLDRDGVISNSIIRDGKGFAPRLFEEFRLLPYAAESISKLKSNGFVVIVVTNQPDIGNGLVETEVLDKMHKKLRALTAVDDIYICPHKQNQNCDCRKPKPGMLVEAAAKYGINLNRSFMVGDRASDVHAGQEAGCKTIFINRHYREEKPSTQTFTTTSLRAAIKLILNNI